MSKLEEVDGGDEMGKVFVGGLSWDTNYDSLLKYFSRYGEVIDCVVMKNPATGKSRGFGFVKFRDPSCVETVLVNGPHVLDGRQVDPKACNPRSMNKGSKSQENRSKKIFIGGLPPDCNEAQLREVFGQYGKVTEVVIMFDQQKQRSREPEIIAELEPISASVYSNTATPSYVPYVNWDRVECKRAEPRDIKAFGDIGFKHLGQALTLSTAGGLLQAGLASGQLSLPGMGMAGVGMLPGGGLMGSGLPASALHGAGLTAAPFQPSSLPPGVAFLASPPGLPLTFAAGGFGMTSPVNGVSNHAALPGLLGAGSGAETDIPAGYTPVAVSRQNAFLPAHLAYSQSAFTQVPTLDAQESAQAGYPTPSTTPVPQQTYGAENGHSQAVVGKNGYIMYNACYSGMLGSYPQEASSYGPARGYLADASSGNPTPYTATVTYAPSPALAALQGAYASELNSAYGGAVALQTLAYGGQGDAPHASYTSPIVPQRSASATQAFHPYRR